MWPQAHAACQTALCFEQRHESELVPPGVCGRQGLPWVAPRESKGLSTGWAGGENSYPERAVWPDLCP